MGPRPRAPGEDGFSTGLWQQGAPSRDRNRLILSFSFSYYLVRAGSVFIPLHLTTMVSHNAWAFRGHPAAEKDSNSFGGGRLKGRPGPCILFALPGEGDDFVVGTCSSKRERSPLGRIGPQSTPVVASGVPAASTPGRPRLLRSCATRISPGGGVVVSGIKKSRQLRASARGTWLQGQKKPVPSGAVRGETGSLWRGPAPDLAREVVFPAQ